MKKILNILLVFCITGLLFFAYQMIENLSIFDRIISEGISKNVYDEFNNLKSSIFLAFIFAVATIISAIILIINKEKCKENVALNAEVLKEEKQNIVVEDLNNEELIKLKKQLDSLNETIINYSSNNSEELIKKTAAIFNAAKGVVYEPNKEKDKIVATATFAHLFESEEDKILAIDEGLIGQAIKNKKVLIIEDVPTHYLKVMSGLGNSNPTSVLIIPFYKANEIEFVIELALFTPVDDVVKDGANYLYKMKQNRL